MLSCRFQGFQRRSNSSKHWEPLPGHKGLEGSDAENISLVDWKPCAWRNPMCAAQSHYSFFQHYRAGSLEVRRSRRPGTIDSHAVCVAECQQSQTHTTKKAAVPGVKVNNVVSNARQTLVDGL